MKINKKVATHPWTKWILLAFILGGMAAAYSTGVFNYLSFSYLKEQRDAMQRYVDYHPILSPFLFMLVYIIATILCFPASFVITMISGFLFMQPLATLYAAISATIGAVTIYIAAKTALKTLFVRHAGKKILRKMHKGFEENAISYMLFLRLVPLFPFWLINVAPAIFQVNIWTYTWTTFIGIIPGSFVFSQAGAGINEIFAQDQGFSLSAIFNWKLKVALSLLAIFALIPLLIKYLRKKYKKKKRH